MGDTRPLRLRNAAFLLRRLAEDCAPLQEYRELTQNAIEAVMRARQKGLETSGDIVWDVDWVLAAEKGVYKLRIIDTGDGMQSEEMQQYINELSSSSSEQSMEGNYGVGAKITAGANNPEGLVYMSWTDGQGSMIHFWNDPSSDEFGLKRFELPDGSFAHGAPIEDGLRPAVVKKNGTVVVLLGKSPDQHTFVREDAPYPTHWLTRYLNRRYYRLPDGITVRVREFSKRDPASWPVTETNRMAEGAQLRQVFGQKYYLDKHAKASGNVELEDAVARWWLLPDDKRVTEQLDLWQTTGHTAALYQNEVYELKEQMSGRRMLQTFGVIFGTSHVVIYVEPRNGKRRITTNTARNQLHIDGLPLPWEVWGEEFRGKMPEAIKEMMDEIASGSGAKDHREAIKQRLKAIRDLFKLTRYRRTASGTIETDGDGGGLPRSEGGKRSDGGGGAGGTGGSTGSLYGAYIKAGGDAAEPVIPRTLEPHVQWVSIADGTREAGDLEDRAARYLPTSHELLINGDFRVFSDMVDHFTSLYAAIAGAPDTVRDAVHEWFEQQLVETVIGVRTLEGSQQWTEDPIKTALSEEALTAAAMPRYHVYQVIKRSLGVALGSLKTAG